MLRRSLSAPKVWPVLLAGMHLAGPLAFRLCGQLPQVSVAGAPCRPSATPSAHSGEPGLVENAPRCCPARPRAGNRSQSPSRPRPPSFHTCGQPTFGSVAGAPCRPSATPCAHSGEPGLVENAPQPASTAPAGADRAPQGASSSAWAPSSNRPSPTTGAFRAAGCVSPWAGAFDAVGDSNPVPHRVTCPRPHRNVPARAGCPQPRRLSTGRPWHPEPLVRQLHQRRRPTTTSGPRTGARSGQAGKARPAPGEGRLPALRWRLPAVG